MKRMIRNMFLLISSTLILFGCSESDTITDVNSDENTAKTVMSQISLEELEKQLGIGELSRIPFDPEEEVSFDDKASTRAPAPPLTQLYVYSVGSADNNNEWEYVNGAYSTTNNHGGAVLYVSTVEVGYATPSSRIAKMNGTRLDYIEAFALKNSSNIIVGYQYFWDATGPNNGDFTYTARSINYPWNTMSTLIYIQ